MGAYVAENEIEYYFDHDPAHKAGSRFSATALWKILPEEARPDEIWFLLTPTAEKMAWSAILDETKSFGVEARPLPLRGGTAVNDTNAFLSTIADRLPEGTSLTLDVTQGLRHHAFLFFALALYVSRFRGNKIEGVWYSRMETDNRHDPKPIIDLKPVLDLAHWFLALSEFQDTGSLKAISRLVENRRAKKLFEQLSQEFLTGLPVEAGMTAAQLTEFLKPEADALANIPLERDVRDLLLKEVEPLQSPFKKKEDYRLSIEELERQAHFISRYLRAGQDNLAFGFMREWMVNQILEKENVTTEWLKHKQRSRVEGQLGCLANLLKQKNDPSRDGLPEELKKQAKRWDTLKELRNALQHNGMRSEAVPRKVAQKLREAWLDKDTPESCIGLPTFGGNAGTLLICPLGNTSGVLFSALSHVRPARCLALCSHQSEDSIQEAVTRADWNGELLALVIQDPYRGIHEFKDLLAQAKVWLFQADQIEANLTGGTSLMGVLVNRLLEHAGRTYRRPKRRFVLIDQRPYDEQKADPWVKGDIHYIDQDFDQAGGEG